MKTPENKKEENQYDQNYINDIHDDWVVFKSLTILALIIFLVLVGFFLWYVQG